MLKKRYGKQFKFEVGQEFITSENEFGVKYTVVKVNYKTVTVQSDGGEFEYTLKKGRARKILIDSLEKQA